MLACLWFLISLAAASAPLAAQDAAQPGPPAFRIRLSNVPLGSVDVSVDGGHRWLLVARVAHPCTAAAAGGTANSPVVERSSPNGLAAGVGGGRIVRILPDRGKPVHDGASMVLNVPPTSALFKDLLPPAGSTVEQVLNRQPAPLPDGYVPHEGDVLLLTAARPPIPPEKLPTVAQDAADRYAEAALAKLKATGRKPASGMLTVTARTAPGDKPTSVVFSLDGSPTAILNTAPFTIRLNTKDWTNGEHLVEVRAYDAQGGVMSQSRALVVVDNRQQ